MAQIDLIVVGAGKIQLVFEHRQHLLTRDPGPFGLISAHTWLELNPNDNVILLEAAPDLGYTSSLINNFQLNL